VPLRLVGSEMCIRDSAKGSIHNRGGAVDITLVDNNGKALDMGTPFDFFGPEASHNYQLLSDEVKQNRVFLKQIMQENGFISFDSEWWHYNLQNASKDKVSNTKWECK
jgi:D-alanyl-D-alanine dipeptidase